MTLEGRRGQFLAIGALPDIAHDATAVTERVRVEEQDRQSRESTGVIIHDLGHRRRRVRGGRTYLVEHHRTSLSLEHFRFTCCHGKSVQDGFFLRKKPLGCVVSVSARIENAVKQGSGRTARCSIEKYRVGRGEVFSILANEVKKAIFIEGPADLGIAQNLIYFTLPLERIRHVRDRSWRCHCIVFPEEGLLSPRISSGTARMP